MNILHLFKPSPTEQAIEAELAGTPTPTRAHVQPPKRGATPAEAASDELHQLRASLQDIEARLASSNHERARLEKENSHLKKSLDETGRMLSAQIASAGRTEGPIPGNLGGIEEEPRGLQRSIQAAKAEASRANPQTRIQRPVI